MSLAGGLRELLRPPPHRGPLVAAGAVSLAVGVSLEELRLDDGLPIGVHMAILLLSGGLLFFLGAQAPNEGGKPPAYQSVLLGAGLPLLFAGLMTTAEALGSDFWAPGALMWTSAVTAALALWPAFERNSAISLLLAAIVGGVALLSAWAWIFDAQSPAPYRWLMAAYAGGLVLCSLALRAPARRHAEVLTDAAGLAIAVIGLSGVSNLNTPIGASGTSGLPWFWDIVVLGAGFGLVAFGAVDRSPGPAYLGVVNLILFILVVGGGDNGTLYWWPLVLIAGGVAMLVAGLRPRAPLPPEPAPYRAGEAPLAARADEEEIVIRVRDDS
jgi:drug/metabolite transporter superfamily protein YnfA